MSQSHKTAVAGLIVAVLFGCILAPQARAQTAEPAAPPAQDWSFTGAAGRYNQAAARRGFQIYTENCAACHSMNLLHYRDLAGIGFTPDQIKAIAAKVTIEAGQDSQGKPVSKTATPADNFHPPFPNDDAARAAMNGALPPDLSLAANAYPHGPDYIAAVLTGYQDPPAGFKLGDSMSYNRYFPGHQIAMPPPLSDGQFTFTDGTASTAAQNAHDVATFLAWAANPDMDERKHLGYRVVLYFLSMAGIAYAFQKRIWADVT